MTNLGGMGLNCVMFSTRPPCSVVRCAIHCAIHDVIHFVMHWFRYDGEHGDWPDQPRGDNLVWWLLNRGAGPSAA